MNVLVVLGVLAERVGQLVDDAERIAGQAWEGDDLDVWSAAKKAADALRVVRDDLASGG